MNCIRLASSILLIYTTEARAASDLLSNDNQHLEAPLHSNPHTRSASQHAALDEQKLPPEETPDGDNLQPSGSAAYNGSMPVFLLGQSQIKAEIYGGFRYDTDANQAVDALVPGQTGITPTSSTLQKQSDWSYATQASVNHQYLFHGARDVMWETNASVLEQHFLHISANYDLTVVGGDTGPRIAIGQVGQTKVSVRPFGSIMWIGYGGNTFASLYGGGLSTEVRAPRWWTNLTGVGRFGNYENSTFRPVTRPYTGPEWQLSTSTTFVLGAATSLTAALSWYQANSQSVNLSRQGPGGAVSVARGFALTRRAAELTLTGSVQRLLYGGPALQPQAAARRDDTQWIADISLGIPILPSTSVTALRLARTVVEYQYLRNVSNYFPFSDHQFTIGLKITL